MWWNVVTVVLSVRQCLQIVTLFAQRPVCLCLSQWDREREERQTRYVLWAMLHDQRRELRWEVRDMRGPRGQGIPVTVTPRMGLRYCMRHDLKGAGGDESWGWTQMHVPSASDTFVGKLAKLANNRKVNRASQLVCYAFSSRFWLRAKTVYSSGATQDRKLT